MACMTPAAGTLWAFDGGHAQLSQRHERAQEVDDAAEHEQPAAGGNAGDGEKNNEGSTRSEETSPTAVGVMEDRVLERKQIIFL